MRSHIDKTHEPALEVGELRRQSDLLRSIERVDADDETRRERYWLDGTPLPTRSEELMQESLWRERARGDARLTRERERCDARHGDERSRADDQLQSERSDRQCAETKLDLERRRVARQQGVLRAAHLSLAAIAGHLALLVEEMIEGDLGRHLRTHAEETERSAQSVQWLIVRCLEVEGEESPSEASASSTECFDSSLAHG